jgi:hypothetical protein
MPNSTSSLEKAPLDSIEELWSFIKRAEKIGLKFVPSDHDCIKGIQSMLADINEISEESDNLTLEERSEIEDLADELKDYFYDCDNNYCTLIDELESEYDSLEKEHPLSAKLIASFVTDYQSIIDNIQSEVSNYCEVICMRVE